jgi:hypothetical protein
MLRGVSGRGRGTAHGPLFVGEAELCDEGVEGACEGRARLDVAHRVACEC